MSRIILVSPDNRYLHGICPRGRALLTKKRERARVYSESWGWKLKRNYMLHGYVFLPIGAMEHDTP